MITVMKLMLDDKQISHYSQGRAVFSSFAAGVCLFAAYFCSYFMTLFAVQMQTGKLAW